MIARLFVTGKITGPHNPPCLIRSKGGDRIIYRGLYHLPGHTLKIVAIGQRHQTDALIYMGDGVILPSEFMAGVKECKRGSTARLFAHDVVVVNHVVR